VIPNLLMVYGTRQGSVLSPVMLVFALALAFMPQVLGLGLGLVLKSLALAMALMVVFGLGLEVFNCLYQPVYCY